MGRPAQDTAKAADKSRRPAYNPYNVAVGQRLKARRLNLRRREGGWTQTDLAERLNMGREALNHYESGRSPVPTEELPRLAGVLGVSVAYILGTEEELPTEVRDVVNLYRSLPPEYQAAAYGFVKELANRYGSRSKDGALE